MRRKYKKPMIAVESFQLNATFAATCSVKVELNSGVHSCDLNDQGIPEFGQACEANGGYDVTVDFPDDQPCYLAANDIASAFSS